MENEMEKTAFLYEKLGIDKKRVNQKQSFIALSKEQIGISVDIVYSSSEQEGWEDFQLLDLQEAWDDDTFAESKKLACKLREELGLVRPVEELVCF